MDRPNILFILFDSAPARWVGIGSTPDVATPNIDRIAAEGVSFTQAYCAAGVCHPARASLDSGLFPHANGQLNNTPGAHSYMFRMRADLPLMPELLRDAGYRCGTATQPDQPRGYADTVPMRRWMDLLEERRSGWDSDGAAERDPDVPHCGRYKLGPEATRDGVYASGAVELIEHYAGLRGPWFLKVDFDGPHLPQHLPDPYHERVSDRTPLPENFHDPLDGKPAVQHHLRQTQQRTGPKTEADWRRFRSYCERGMELLDQYVGWLVDALARTGQADRTALVISSDHGEYFGSHGFWTKFPSMYDELMQIPLIVRMPGGPGAGRTCSAMVQQVDILPMLLDIAGAPIPDNLHGQSLLPLVRGDDIRWREHAFAECFGLGEVWHTIRMIRTSRWKYCFHPADEDELYDLDNDAHELCNLVSELGHADVLSDLRARLRAIMERYGDPAAQLLL